MAKKKLKMIDRKTGDEEKIPIANLPEKFLWMQVNSGTKIRNVLGYALKEFSKHDTVVWSGAGQGIGKVISSAELMKRKHPGLHQITRLHYVKSKNAISEAGDDNIESRSVPKIHILLSKVSLDPKEPGYQAPDNSGSFWKPDVKPTETPKKNELQIRSSNKMSNIATAEFAAMGLRTGQKRPRKWRQQSEVVQKKNMKRGKNV